MSLVSTYVLCTDGQMYRDPTWHGRHENRLKWFLCFDDDDPPELVIESARGMNPQLVRQIASAILAGLPIRRFKLGKVEPGVSGRIFPQDGPKSLKFVQAYSLFVSLYEPLPPPQKHDGFAHHQPMQGVFYTFGLPMPTFQK